MEKASTSEFSQLLVFSIDESSFALPVSAVERVIHSLSVKKLPEAPEIIKGIIDIKGQIIPIIDIRRRFQLAEKEIEADDRIIIANTGVRTIAFFVDFVDGIKNIPSKKLLSSHNTLSFEGAIKGVAKIEDDLVFIYNLELFLDLEEEKKLDKALKQSTK